MSFLLNMLTIAPLGQGLFCENFKDAQNNPPPGTEFIITEDALFFLQTEDGLNDLITET